MTTTAAPQTQIETPIGALHILADEHGVIFAGFNEPPTATVHSLDYLNHCVEKTKNAWKHVEDAASKFAAYFRGDLAAPEKITLSPSGTDFQRTMWGALRRIAPGKTVSYQSLATDAGWPGAARAAGSACRANPIILAIPCHRVIGKNKSLTGFNAGIHRKEFLLNHEAGIAGDSSKPAFSRDAHR